MVSITTTNTEPKELIIVEGESTLLSQKFSATPTKFGKKETELFIVEGESAKGFIEFMKHIRWMNNEKKRKVNLKKAKKLSVHNTRHFNTFLTDDTTKREKRNYLRFKTMAIKYAKKNDMTYDQAFGYLIGKRLKKISDRWPRIIKKAKRK
jgi:DNA gyrase/topoisomerase IV subunit B